MDTTRDRKKERKKENEENKVRKGDRRKWKTGWIAYESKK
jgi:hypothetical protein